MTLFLDARLQIGFGTADQAGPETALLIEGDAPAPAGVAVARFVLAPVVVAPVVVAPVVVAEAVHPAGCACCAPRGPAAEALGRLFLERARGGVLFREVIAVVRGPAGAAAVRAAVAGDPLVSARFRLG
ncbi:MAG: hypothetical protein HIU82_12865 [Proteobacteria bacterium]|nr:hypothetical protein [Pseudomonadota bacterium]